MFSVRAAVQSQRCGGKKKNCRETETMCDNKPKNKKDKLKCTLCP